MSDALDRLLEARWPLVRDEACAKLVWMRSTIAFDVDAALGERSEARAAAHQLRGRLGMYGRRDASVLAGAVEDLLASPPTPHDVSTTATVAHDLMSLVDQLQRMLTAEPSAIAR